MQGGHLPAQIYLLFALSVKINTFWGDRLYTHCNQSGQVHLAGQQYLDILAWVPCLEVTQLLCTLGFVICTAFTNFKNLRTHRTVQQLKHTGGTGRSVGCTRRAQGGAPDFLRLRGTKTTT